MKIQLEAIKMNKTKKYLIPCLKEHGKVFVEMISRVKKIAYGLGDMLINKDYEKHIFILIDTSKFPKYFVALLEYLHEQDFYEDDYAFDEIHNGIFHMVIIKLPESCYGKFDFFTKGEYSKMYSPEQIKQFKDREVKQVLIKDHNYKLEFTKKVNKIFQSNLKVDEVEDRELDLPPTVEFDEEVF